MHKHGPVLSGSEIEQFVEVGYVRVEQAIPSAVAQQCRDLAMEQLEIPASAPWPEPVVRGVVDGEPFHQAANAPRLLEAVGQLLEGEAWQTRPNLGLLVGELKQRQSQVLPARVRVRWVTPLGDETASMS